MVDLRLTKTPGRSTRGFVNSDGEVFLRAGLSREKEQLRFVETEFELVGRHPTGDVRRARGDACLNLSARGWKRKVERVNDIYCVSDEMQHKSLCLPEQFTQVTSSEGK